MAFEIKYRDGMGRIGLLETPHGRVETPALMPVVNPKKPVIPVEELVKTYKSEIIITNSYIIYRDPELREEALKRGVHELLGFKGPIMTDSGAFQMYVYGDVQVEPLEIVRFQREMGSDIGVILDIFGNPYEEESVVRWWVEETVKRAQMAVAEKGNMLLACTVQGGRYPHLRAECARKLSELDADVYPIGGVVPLMENYKFRDLVEVIISSKLNLPPEKPVHLFGCGHPMIFAIAVLLGCDLFDSASYSKYAADDRVILPTRTVRLEELDYIPCSCPVCSKYDVKELKEMRREERFPLIARHNLFVSFEEIRRVKQAIKEGMLWELAEQRARAHPNLTAAFRVIGKYVDKMERYDPVIKKSAFFHLSCESLSRPEPYRYAKRLKERYKRPPDAKILLLLPDRGEKPYTVDYSSELSELKKALGDLFNHVHVAFLTIFGIVPIELEEIYPVQQSVIQKRFTSDELKYVEHRMLEYFSKNTYEHVLYLRGGVDFDDLVSRIAYRFLISMCDDVGDVADTIKRISQETTVRPRVFELEKLIAVADYQFGEGAGEALFMPADKIRWELSKQTGKIRFVYRDDELILTLVPTTGFFTLMPRAAKLLVRRLEYPRLRVVVNEDAEPFVKRGRSVFPKFIVDCDPEIRPEEEVIVVNENDDVLAVGRALLSGVEMKRFRRGVAVKVRRGVEKSKK